MDVSLSELQEFVMDRRPGVLRFMGSQRVGHDWATELNWTECIFKYNTKGTNCERNKLDLIKNLYSAKLTFKIIKKQTIDYEKISAKYTPGKDYYPKTYKEFLKFNNNKANNPI